MPGGAEQGNIVKDYMIGNTHVIICDDYCRDKTQVEIDIILKRIASNALEELSTAATVRCQKSSEAIDSGEE